MMMNNYYYPITQYHLFISYLISKNKNNRNLIIEKDKFSEQKIKIIINENYWNKILIIKEKGALENIETKEKEELKEGCSIIYFSPGSKKCNYFINECGIKSRIYMAEDGIAPYYFSNIKKGWEISINRRGIIGKIVIFIKKIMYKKYLFNYNLVKKIYVIDSSLLADKNVDSEDIELSEVEDALNSIKNLYIEELNFIDKNLNKKIEYVLFDYDYDYKLSYSKEVDIKIKFLKKYIGKTILIKFKNKKNKIIRSKIYKSIEQKIGVRFIIIDGMEEIPWEVIYKEFYKYLKSAELISEYLTTSILSMHTIFKEKNIIKIYSNKYGYKLQNKKLINDIDTFIEKLNKINIINIKNIIS